MNLSKTIALAAIAATVGVVGIHVARAQTAASCNDQPNMAHALSSLQAAKGSLDKAEHDKGGWRGKAVEATANAIKETETGCATADKK